MSDDPFACIWLQHQERTPTVRLVANPDYWDHRRGSHVGEVVFRNDLSPERSLELVCTSEGEVDILTEVPPWEAGRVEASVHAKLVTIDALRSVVGIIDREADGLTLAHRQARLALNLAVDRTRLIEEAYCGPAPRRPHAHGGAHQARPGRAAALCPRP